MRHVIRWRVSKDVRWRHGYGVDPRFVMQINPTESGGRTLQGNTPRGDYHIEVYCDHDGPVYGENGELVATLKMVIKAPPSPVLTDEQKRIAADRRAACEACPAHTDLTDTTVTCRQQLRTCQQHKKLTNQGTICPLGAWPEQESG